MSEAQTEDNKHNSRKFWKIVVVIIIVSSIIGLTGPYMTFAGVQDLAERVEEARGPPEIRFSDGYAKHTSEK